MFTAPFCQALLEELEHFEQSDMPKGRPNTMNNYGVGEAPPRQHKEAGTSVWGDVFPAQTSSKPLSHHL